MWDSLWINARLVTCASNISDYGLLDHAALAVQAGKIVWLGAMHELSLPYQALAKKVIDVKQQILTPGLIDSHTHLVYAGDRIKDFSLRLQGLSYQEITAQGGGIVSTVKATEAASFAELYQISAARLLTMLKYGTTTVEIKSGYGLMPETEIKQLEVIKQLQLNHPMTIYPTFLAAHALPSEFLSDPDKYIDLVCEHTLPLVIEKNLALAVDAYCEKIAFNPAQIARIFKIAKQAGLSIKLHAEQFTDYGGALLAAEYQALSVDHLEYATEAGIAALAGSKSVAVLLPGAFYFLNETQQPPLKWLRLYKLPIALATDNNPGTAPTSSLPMMMNMAAVLWGMTPVETLRATTIHAAQALGMAHERGSLEVNKIADFAIWDIASPEELTYRIGDLQPTMVIKHGEIIVDENVSHF